MAAKPKKVVEACKRCKHYHVADDTQGFCRRYPPVVPAMNYSQFPSVKAEWNCGEFART